MILGVDVGKKRVGVAIAKPPAYKAQAFTCFPRGQYQAEKELISIIKDNAVKIMVVGIPLNEDNQETSASSDVRKFCARLTKRIDIKIEFIDEWGSSLLAKQRLGKNALGQAAREKGVIDAEAASIILQVYLDKTTKIG